ncbi:MAG TPA: Mov34/MPN/PAD-1 family protein [Polyangia bacterium]|jgi:proteasome lid subunit RPN8/RPN11|nr:Mov34/MPN/PAD-1 family protein [Polyangia bacterium]
MSSQTTAATAVHPVVTPEALAAIYDHAEREYPHECCGIIYGPRGSMIADRAEARVNAQNRLHAEDPVRYPRDARTAYNFETKDLFDLQRSLRGDNPAKIIYHSHVDVGAYFSKEDAAAALCEDEPWYPVEYVVIDVKPDRARSAAQFAWDPGARAFVEVARY